MKRLSTILALVLFPVMAFGQTICNLPATGPQPYSKTGTGVPQYVPGALNELLGYIPKAYVPLPGMPPSPLAFCGPQWTANYDYKVGELIEPIPGGDVFQAIQCAGSCTSGSTQPAAFSGALYHPSPVGVWTSTCTDPGTTATCETVDAVGESEPVNYGEPYVGADVGATIVVTDYDNAAYDGSWTVTASTIVSPYTFSFTASGFMSGSCTGIGKVPNCTTYQQGSQVVDSHVTWQDVGPQNEIALLTPTVTVTSASTIPITQPLPVTVTVSGGSGNPTPTGTVTLTSGSYNSGPTTLTSGSATITIPAGMLAVGMDTLTASYSGDSNYSPGQPGTASVTVTQAQTPGFTITGTAVSVSPGATTGNTSTITVTPTGGFMGNVTLMAVVTTSPAGAQDLPTFSFGSTSPVDITGTSSVTATLTISTTPPTGATLAHPARPGARGYATGGTGLLAFALLLGMAVVIPATAIPARHHNWRTRVGMMLLLVALIGGLFACGSGNAAPGNSGTTPGTYIVTVTGTSGSTTAQGTVTLTVQ